MRWIISMMILAMAFLVSASASVALADEGGCDVACCDAGYDSCNSGGCGGLVADVELTFLRYFQEGGPTDILGAPVETDYEFAPRFVLGYAGANGLGLRTRYWELDASAVSVAGNPCGVNAYNIDVECFQEYCLGCDTTLELSLGVRYAELWQDSANLQDFEYGVFGISGFGGTMAAEVNRNVFNGSLYARARLSLLMGDAAARLTDPTGALIDSSYADDCTVTQTELGIGYEICRCTRLGTVTLRSGVEWQNWANMAVADAPFNNLGDVMDDAGFAGFVVGFGLER